MKYKGSENNIYSSDNIDPEFIEYLYKLPAKMLDDLFMAWVMLDNDSSKVPIINIDAVYNVKSKKNITKIQNEEVIEMYKYLKNNKIDLTKL